MNENFTSDSKKIYRKGISNGEKTIYEDDGFFSDVPISGSLSKSLLALNNYVKKNLLYDDNDVYKNDSAYFSKESSPNESRTKYDSDSLKSNDSNEKEEHIVITPSSTSQVIRLSDKPIDVNKNEPTNETTNVAELTDDYKSMQLIDQSRIGGVANSNTIITYVNIISSKTQSVKELPVDISETENQLQHNSSASGLQGYNFENVKYEELFDAESDTNDVYSFETVDESHLEHNAILRRYKLPNIIECDETYDSSVNAVRRLSFSSTKSETNAELHSFSDAKYEPGYNTDSPKYNVANVTNSEEYVDNKNARKITVSMMHSNDNKHNILHHNSVSLNNLSNIESENVNSNRDKVVFRENSSDIKRNDDRHTMHEFSDWGNRTDIYPDVYAPLPYKSPRRYVESDVNIHYRCPVRHDPLPLVPERELARQQAEHMKRLYREQRRNKYLQELQDMQNRRHQDNFTPSQKTVVPLNRYDEADKVVAAKALYTFNGQTQRELSFKKGDLIHVRRQIDNNWYEGELHGRIGLFPYNYVEIQKGDVIQAPKKPAIVEGRARAKFDFTAQTNLELPLKKGEVVVLTRRIDQNWWEGRNGSKTGIFPDSYVTVLQEPSQSKPEPAAVASGEKPVASPAAHGMLNGSAKRSMGSHSYTPQPNSPALSNAPQPTQPLPGYVARPAQATLSAAERGYGPPAARGVDLNNTEPLYVDTNAEAIPYRAMYKYRPQNPDELELNEGDTVYVLEKCDDGWYVGSSQRTGRFGTFPGNYVERI